MIALAFQEGDFVWCAFPEHERPLEPGPLHLGYTLAVAGTSPFEPGLPSALVGFTTSQPWPTGVPLPLGVFAFERKAADAFGQSRVFIMDL